jgi:hypothetical protein
LKMSRTHAKTPAAILLLTVVGLLANSNAQAPKRAGRESPCPDDKTYTGTYRNLVYGFSIVIPAGLKGYWNSARCAPDEKYGCVCMGDHGRFIPLSSDASIDAFVSYEIESEWNAKDREKSDISYVRNQSDVRQLTIIESKRFRLGRLNGRRFVVEFVQNDKKVVEDHVIALHKGVEYELILHTLANRYRNDKAQFEKIIASWKLTPRLG